MESRVTLLSASHNRVCNVNAQEVTRNLRLNETKTVAVKSNIRLRSGQTAVLTCKINVREEISIITLPETQKIKGVSIESGVHNIRNRKVKIVVPTI